MISVSTIAILVAIDLLGLGAIWLYVKSQLRKALELDSLLADIRKEVGILTTELNQTTDRNISLVEDRMEALHSLLDEADRRMGVVKRELETKASEREVYSRLGKPHPVQGTRPQRSQPPLPGLEPAASSVESQRSEEWPGSVGSPAPEPYMAGTQASGLRMPGLSGESPIRLDLPRKPVEIIQTHESVIPAKSLREQALDLYSRGFSADIIAARLGTTVAEMDLLISLEEERRQSEGR